MTCTTTSASNWLVSRSPSVVSSSGLGEYHISEELRQELVELQQQTLKLARNVRQLSHDLHPAVLQHLGLVKGLTSYCGELGRAHGVTMTCTAEGDFGAVTPDAALCVYRIAQEALRNVIAHAGASARAGEAASGGSLSADHDRGRWTGIRCRRPR